MYEKCGTPCYAAPEILRGLGYTTKCDIFSLGSLFFNLLTGRFLFPGANKQQVMQRNTECDLHWVGEYVTEFVSESCKQLLLSMLEVEPSNRPSAKQALMNSWFK